MIRDLPFPFCVGIFFFRLSIFTGSFCKMHEKPHINDNKIVNQAIAGDETAFWQLMNRYKESLFAYMQHKFPVGDAAEDLLLIAFDKAFRSLERYNPQFAFSTWLYTIADNTCIDYVRKKKILAQEFHRLSQSFDLNEALFIYSNPETELIASQECALLLHSINKLKPIYRDPARLRFLFDYAYEEIAKALSIPQGTVKTRIHRAKEILSKDLKQ